MKASKIVGIVCWSIAALALTSLLVNSLITGTSPFIFYMGGASYTSSYTVTVDETSFESISAHWNSGYVDITPYAGDKIQLKFLSSKEFEENKKGYYLDSSTLYINSKDFAQHELGFLFFRTREVALEIKIPKDFKLNSLNVNTSSGDINVRGLQLEALSLNSTSGDIESEGIKSKNINLNTTSGDVKIGKNEAEAKELDINTVSGDIRAIGNYDNVKFSTTSGDIEGNGNIKNSVYASTTSGNVFVNTFSCPAREITAKSTSGNCSIAIPENSGFTVNYSTVSGNVSIDDFAVKHNSNQYIYKDGGLPINMESVSGNLHILQS